MDFELFKELFGFHSNSKTVARSGDYFVFLVLQLDCAFSVANHFL
jgi:hypothetical protein